MTPSTINAYYTPLNNQVFKIQHPLCSGISDSDRLPCWNLASSLLQHGKAAQPQLWSDSYFHWKGKFKFNRQGVVIYFTDWKRWTLIVMKIFRRDGSGDGSRTLPCFWRPGASIRCRGQHGGSWSSSSIFLFSHPLSMTNSTLSSLLWRQTGGKMEPLMLIRRRSSASRMSKKYRLPLNNQY